MCWENVGDPQLVYQIKEGNRQINYLTQENEELKEKIVLLEQKLKKLEEEKKIREKAERDSSKNFPKSWGY